MWIFLIYSTRSMQYPTVVILRNTHTHKPILKESRFVANVFKTRIQNRFCDRIPKLHNHQRWQRASRSRRRSMIWKGHLTIFFHTQKISRTMTRRHEQSRSMYWFYPSKRAIEHCQTRPLSSLNLTVKKRTRGTMKKECRHYIHLLGKLKEIGVVLPSPNRMF
jgi:hypothetical protein